MFSRADAYERFMGRWSRQIAPSLVAFAGIRDGDTVLDVGAGTGALTRALREAGRSVRVTGVDPSQDYVADATARNADPQVRFEVGDARQLAFDDAAFDATLSLFAINFVPEPARAVGEMRRVTRPRVVAAAVWDYGEGMEMLRVLWDEAIALDPSIDPRDERHMPLCRRGELAALWRAAGLADVEESPLEMQLRFQSFDDFWAPFLLGQGPAGAHVAGLAADRQALLADGLRRRLLADGPDRAFELRGCAWAVKGVTQSAAGHDAMAKHTE